MERDGQPVLLPVGKQRALLATLTLRPERATSTEEIANRLWDESPPAAAGTTVRGYVKRLRSLLDGQDEASVIHTRHKAYQLDISPEDVDLCCFRQMVARSAKATDPAEEASLLRHALELWRGPLLCDVDCESLHRDVVPAVQELYMQALNRRIDLDLAREPANVIAELRQIVADNPLQERFWGQLMLALHRAGRQSEALTSYVACRDVLVENLGVDPSAQVRELHQRILVEDPTLLQHAVPPRDVPNSPSPRQGAGPWQLPPEVPQFVGRHQQLAQLDEIMVAQDRPAPIVIVDGPAGAGKTALTVRWAYRSRNAFPDGALYVNLKGYGPDEPLDPAAALTTLLREVQPATECPPRDIGTCSSLFRSAMAGRRMLVVLDNAASADQLRPLLPGANNIALITSRNQLRGLVAREGAKRVRLDRFGEDDATCLLCTLVGEQGCGAESEVVRELARLCGGLPLALRIVAERVVRSPQSPLAELVTALQDDGIRLDALSCGDASTDLQTVLSWSYRTIPADAARLLHLLGRRREPMIDVRVAAELLSVSFRTAGRLLDMLAEANLLRQCVPGLFELDQLVGELAARQLTTGEGDTRNSTARLRAARAG